MSKNLDYLCSTLQGYKIKKQIYETMSKGKDNIRAIVAKSVSEKHGIKTNHFYKVVRGDRNNDELLADAFDLEQCIKQVLNDYKENRLLTAVEELVPFN